MSDIEVSSNESEADLSPPTSLTQDFSPPTSPEASGRLEHSPITSPSPDTSSGSDCPAKRKRKTLRAEANVVDQNVFEPHMDYYQPNDGNQDSSLDSIATILSSSHSELSDSSNLSAIQSESDDDIPSICSESNGGSSCEDESGTDHLLKLFEGSSFTKDTAILKFMTLYLKERWTKKSLDSTLKLVKSMLPEPNELPSSSFSIFKYIESIAPAPNEITHRYCRKCQILLDAVSDNCVQCNEIDIGKFFELPISSQVKFLFEQRNLASVIDANNLCNNSSLNDPSQCIKDINDGTEYIKVKSKLPGKYDLVLLWNTDGVALSKSSKVSLYPILAVIAEVPPDLRALFALVLGVWCDSIKPDMNLFLHPFSKSLRELYDDGGVSWIHPESNVTYKSQVVAPVLCADAAAKAMVLHVQQYNAKHGCNVCEQKTQKINLNQPQEYGRVQKIRAKRCFVFQEEECTLRSGERMERQANLAQQKGDDSCYGVKPGNAVVSEIPFLDRGLCICAEYLHQLLLGVVKYFTNIMFFKKGGDWYVGDQIDQVDSFIEKSIKVPDFVTRCPRKISLLKFWKGSELRSWLLYYSLPALKMFLPDHYFQHWLLLVWASYCLLQDTISNDDFAIATIMLRCFVRDVGELYGYECYTYNVHNLLHLPLLVKRWGPLWATSAFLFESLNGYLNDLLHGTKHLGQELINNVRVCLGLQVLRNIVKGYLPQYPETEESEKVLGKSLSTTFLSTSEETVLAEAGFGHDFLLFKRAQKKSQLFTSKGYDAQKRRCNSYVKFQDTNSSGYGQILYFVVYNGDVYCLIEKQSVEHTRIFFHFQSVNRIKHLIPVTAESNKNILVPFKHVQEKLIKADQYLCLRPNSIEVNL